MLDDKEMLQFIMKTAEMGCRGINAIKHYANSEEMSNALRAQTIEYGRIYHNAYNMLRERNQPSCHVSPMSNSMAKMVVNRQMKNDSSDPHIAEMMIRGNTIGVQKTSRRIRQYNKSDESISKLAQKLMATEQANIEEMKSYL